MNTDTLIHQLRETIQPFSVIYADLLEILAHQSNAIQYHMQINGHETLPLALADVYQGSIKTLESMTKLLNTQLAAAAQTHAAVAEVRKAEVPPAPPTEPETNDDSLRDIPE